MTAELPPHPDVVALTDEDRAFLGALADRSVALPAGAEEALADSSPRLRELREAYASFGAPAEGASRWAAERVESFLDLRYFRGETLITWHRRELPRATRLKYFIFLRAVEDRDALGLLPRLGEDGRFGCWSFEYPGRGRVSHDLLSSVNEINFCERSLGLGRRERFSVLDIGAGYGRLAHRMAAAYPRLIDYCCVDAVAESTFVCEYYLAHRNCSPPARAVALDRVAVDLEPGSFDLALNIHGFSECTLAAVSWWIDLLVRLRVGELLIVPNEPTDLLTLEADGSRLDYRPLLEAAGYRLELCEPVIDDPAARGLLELDDHFHLFKLGG